MQTGTEPRGTVHPCELQKPRTAEPTHDIEPHFHPSIQPPPPPPGTSLQHPPSTCNPPLPPSGHIPAHPSCWFSSKQPPPPTADDLNPALPTLNYGFMVYSLLWAMQDLYHQPYLHLTPSFPSPKRPPFRNSGLSTLHPLSKHRSAVSSQTPSIQPPPSAVSSQAPSFQPDSIVMEFNGGAEEGIG